jgi:hypothetical protein
VNKDILGKGEFLEIYTDMDSDSFGFGSVVAVDGENAVIANIEPSGEEGGLILYKVDDIFKVAKDTLYCKKMLRLMQAKKTEIPTEAFCGDDLILEILDIAKKNKKPVDIQICNSHKSDLWGFVKAYDKDILEISAVNFSGQADGTLFCRIEDITSIKYNAVEDRDILLFLDL